MLNSRERSNLLSMANKLSATVYVGKLGITEAVLSQIDEMLNDHELIKIGVQKNADLTSKEVMNILVEELSCEPVHAIGSKVIIYRYSNKEGIEHIDYKSSKEALEAKRKYETDKKTVNTKKNVKAYGTAKQGVKSDKSTMGNFDKRTSGGYNVKFGKNGRTSGKTQTASKNGKAKGFSPEKKNGVTVYKNGKRYGNKK